ncbi:membrane protein [Microbacterium phage Big4]|nr:membrane protein [Microbacterium phage Big4]
MNKPQGFIHKEKRYWDGYRWHDAKAWVIGRVRVSYAAVGALVFITTVAFTVAQIIVGTTSGWNNLGPLLTYFGIVGLFLAAQIIVGIINFFRWLAGEFSIIKPGDH